MRESSHRRRWLRLAGCAVTATVVMATPRVARSVRASDQPGDATQDALAAPLISTMTGVYNAAQATRGEETYMAICVACHPRGTYTTATFRTAWAGRPLSDLFDLIREKMPKSDPGSLTPAEYAQAIAYLLKINDVPAGEQELPAEGVALKKIRIEWPSPASVGPRER